jgi:hypothetical protein
MPLIGLALGGTFPRRRGGWQWGVPAPMHPLPECFRSSASCEPPVPLGDFACRPVCRNLPTDGERIHGTSNPLRGQIVGDPRKNGRIPDRFAGLLAHRSNPAVQLPADPFHTPRCLRHRKTGRLSCRFRYSARQGRPFFRPAAVTPLGKVWQPRQTRPARLSKVARTDQTVSIDKSAF